VVQQVNLAEAQVHRLDLINAAIRGETVLIIKDDQQTVQLVPATHPMHRRQFGSAKGLIVMAEDFDAQENHPH
jgi:antitoxin (DNA-binding transcriptional repressor) of toxin-antitoxin stability system